MALCAARFEVKNVFKILNVQSDTQSLLIKSFEVIKTERLGSQKAKEAIFYLENK